MRTIATPILVAKNLNQINRWSVIDYHDMVFKQPPRVHITILVDKNTSNIYGSYTCIVYDKQASLCLTVNSTPADFNDQLLLDYRDLSAVLPYTTIVSAFDKAIGNKKARMEAIEPLLLNLGLVDNALA
jgi:hypothetical protein